MKDLNIPKKLISKNKSLRTLSIISLSASLIIMIVHFISLFKSQQKIDLIFIIELLFFFIITITIYFINSELEDAFNKSYKYSKRLEELNKYLDEKVKLRTRQLELSFEQQAESVHSEAIMGSIAQPMLHDLSAPTSALELAFILFDEGKNDNKEIIIRAKESVNQITRIISNGRDLMNKKSTTIDFNPALIISTVEFVLRDKLNKSSISISNKVDQKIELTGIPVLFEKIVINVVLNAIEELSRSSNNNKVIKIIGSKEGKFFTLEIIDNGRGMKKELIEKIFDLKFSLKGETNLGFGLSFVKNTIQKYFDGSIVIESIENSFTKFTLRFKLKELNNMF